MTSDLNAWLALHRRRWWALVQHDDGAPDHFDDLARRTAPHVPSRRVYSPRWEPDSAFCPACDPDYYDLPPDLAAEWAAWRERWQAFCRANPRVRLASILGWISETHIFTSWPNGWEHVIRDWVRAGLPDPRPFDDRLGIDTPAWRRDLAETAAAAGNGWVIWGDEGREWIDG